MNMMMMHPRQSEPVQSGTGPFSEKKEEVENPDLIRQQDFLRAFRNHFTNEDALKRVQQVVKMNFNINVGLPQSKKLLEQFWDDKKVRNKKHFFEFKDEELAKWFSDFVKEHR